MVVVNQLTFPAGSPKGQSGVNLIFDFDESIEHHRTTVVQVHSVLLHTWLVSRLVWILFRERRGRECVCVCVCVCVCERERERERCVNNR